MSQIRLFFKPMCETARGPQTMEAMEADFNGGDLLQEPACCGSSGSGLLKVSRPTDYGSNGSRLQW
jgi:hypothetical protein